MGRKPHTVETLLARYVGEELEPYECWIWKGTAARAKRGYGSPSPMARLAGRLGPARRLIYEAMVQALPPGARLKCGCGQPLCVNPRHAINPLGSPDELAPLTEEDLREVLALLPPNERTAEHIRAGDFGFPEHIIRAVLG